MISSAALYLFAVATVAAFVGQHVVRKLIIVLGRSSLIIFILAFTIFVSAISLGEISVYKLELGNCTLIIIIFIPCKV